MPTHRILDQLQATFNVLYAEPVNALCVPASLFKCTREKLEKDVCVNNASYVRGP